MNKGILGNKVHIKSTQEQRDDIVNNIELFKDNNIGVPKDYLDKLYTLNRLLEDMENKNPEYFVWHKKNQIIN